MTDELNRQLFSTYGSKNICVSNQLAALVIGVERLKLELNL